MRKHHIMGLGALVILAAPLVATAGVHMIPTSGASPDPSNPWLYKTPPMSGSQTFTIQWAVHVKFQDPHWAGVRFTAHVLDAGEMDLNSINVLPGLLAGSTIPAGPGSTTTIGGTWWHPAAMSSGTYAASQVIPFGTWTIHVNGSSPGQNSDTDATAAGSSIFHLGSTQHLPGSTMIHAEDVDYVWATSGFTPTESEPFPQNPPHPDNSLGEWKPVPDVPTSVSFHVTPLMASGFYSKRLGGAGLGIEHVPEPGTGLALLVGGGIAVLGTRRARRRRQP